MPSRDSLLVSAFLDEFARALAAKFPEDLDFILLFGSAARGEWRAGVSDVDLIIQAKSAEAAPRIDRFAERLFWRLDKKHGTMLRQVCSTKRRGALSRLEKKVRLYKPFEVISPRDIDWENGNLSLRTMGAFALVAPVTQFAKKVRREGKILYGRNILKEMKIRESFADTLKSMLVPYLLSLAAIPVALALPDRGLKYSIKAVLYGIDNQLSLAGGDYQRKTRLNILILRSELGELFSVRLAHEALMARRNFEKTSREWSYLDKLAFCLQAPVYIAHNNAMGALSAIRRAFGG